MARGFARAWSLGWVLLLLFALLATGCKKEPVRENKLLPLRIARYYWPGQYWVDIAAENGLFKDAGLDVELVDTNPDYLRSLQDVADGRLDAQNFALFDLVSFNLQGHDLCGIIYLDGSEGAESLIAGVSIRSAADLKGRRISMPANSYIEYMLEVLLDRDRVAHEGVTILDVPGEHALEPFARGEADAVFTWEPFATEALGVSGAHRLFISSELPGISPALLTLRTRTVAERPDDLQKLAGVWKRTTELIKSDPDAAFAIIAGIYNVSIKDAAAFAETDRIMSLRENRIAFAYASGHESLHGSAIRMNEHLIERGRATRRIDTLDILDQRFIRNLE